MKKVLLSLVISLMMTGSGYASEIFESRLGKQIHDANCEYLYQTMVGSVIKARVAFINKKNHKEEKELKKANSVINIHSTLCARR